jgi:hypothetical protein
MQSNFPRMGSIYWLLTSNIELHSEQEPIRIVELSVLRIDIVVFLLEDSFQRLQRRQFHSTNCTSRL